MSKFTHLKKWAAVGCLALASSFNAGATTWTLTGAVVTHDPSVYKEGNTWWITETSDTGIGVKYSPDGRAWTQGVSIFGGGLSWWGQYNGNSKTVWAPDIHVWNGKAIMYYAVSTFGNQKSAIGLATASSIAQGNWTDKGVVITSALGDNFNAIDPNFVVDKSGQPWLSYGSFWDGIFLTRVDANTLKPIGTKYRLADDAAGIENPFIIANGSYYYLFVSKGTCCAGANSTYHISYGRSTSITGPYVDKNGVDMRNGGGTVLDSGGARFIAPGGESISNGAMVRHRLDSQNNYNGVLFISDLYFTNGWPTF